MPVINMAEAACHARAPDCAPCGEQTAPTFANEEYWFRAVQRVSSD